VTGSALTIESLSAGYGARRVLQGLTLPPLPLGEVTALVGPNGAGKSTLLRVLAGLIPGRGSAKLGGDEILRLHPRQRARTVSFMPQMLPQRVALTVLEGVIAALRASPVSGSGDDDGSSDALVRRAIAVLDRIGIVDLAHEPLDALSGGQRQLASLAQAVVRDPAILLLDEPTSALDLRHQAIVIDIVRQFAAAGRIVIVVVHDLSLAARWADRVVVLGRGTAAAVGTPEQALTPDVLARVYGVRARVERCTRGRIQVIVDGIADDHDHLVRSDAQA
jgi:iron complex transport system ATP-binding protein